MSVPCTHNQVFQTEIKVFPDCRGRDVAAVLATVAVLGVCLPAGSFFSFFSFSARRERTLRGARHRGRKKDLEPAPRVVRLAKGGRFGQEREERVDRDGAGARGPAGGCGHVQHVEDVGIELVSRHAAIDFVQARPQLLPRHLRLKGQPLAPDATVWQAE